tara:strand:+ start:4668 stop:5144 length:477 start_codon:yes stop_codon:yes gene_type:complete
MKNTLYVLILMIMSCSRTTKPTTIFDNVSNISVSELDSVKIFDLVRFGMETYERGSQVYKLSDDEVEHLVKQLKDSSNFHRGGPLSFGFTSVIEFYSKNKINSIDIAPDSYKVFQVDFEIPYNKFEEIQSLGAVSFPFIKEDFSLFLKQLENKIPIHE